MKTVSKCVAAVAMLLAGVLSAHAGKTLWEVTGLDTPESALADVDGGVIYVSNIGGKPLDKDGNGFISKVGLDGKVIALKWATGLDGPKGLARVGNKLYAADVDGLAEISIPDGKIVATYKAPGANFMNDVAADGEGRVYVADTGTNIIWRLADGKFEKWLESKDLNFPNGLLVQGDKLIVASWGVMAEDGKPGVPAGLLTVSLADKTIRPLGDGTPVGNLDGIEPFDTSSYLVTDWVAGVLYRIDTAGKAKALMNFKQGSADIGYIPASKTVLVPLMLENKLEAYTLD